MATVSLSNKVSFLLLLILTTTVHSSLSTAKPKICDITSVYQFGDSLSDGGNSVIFNNAIARRSYGLPYGETYFKRPTGRYSDGRIICDFIVHALNLPLLSASLDKKGTFDQGANFGFSAATALNNSFWAARNVKLDAQNKHLTIQLEWFKSHLQSTYGSDCTHALKNSLIIFGEFGGADYIFSFGQGKRVPEMQTYVPFVIAGIVQGIRDVIQMGATRILVPGVLPFGCLPSYLNKYATNNPNAYDEYSCLKFLNDFCSYHNTQLKSALENLLSEFPSVTIVYADYYEGYLNMFRKASWFGFDTVRSACCGAGGKYNINVGCRIGARACPNPDKYISWDGSHMTDAGNQHVADFVLDDVLPEFKCDRFGDSSLVFSS